MIKLGTVCDRIESRIESAICRLTRSTTVRRIVQAYCICIMLSYVTRVAWCVWNFVDLQKIHQTEYEEEQEPE